MLLVIIAISCANTAPLGGGPKDVSPPVLQSCDPPDNSVNFSDDRIFFNFDEYIQMKNAQQKLLISPPMQNPPELREKNRMLTVVFKSVPEPNTTYTLNFADGIADLTEGNAIQQFIYTFSTGPRADSLKVSGRVINSFTLEPEKNVSVFLYSEKSDSLPYKATPYYVTRTDALGHFRFINMKESSYTIVAINDKNNNYKFDPPDETIGFLSDEIIPYVTTKTDTAVTDSLPPQIITVFGPDTLTIFSFTDQIFGQKIKKANRLSAHKAEILFSKESPFKPSVKCIFPDNSEWVHHYSLKNDSLILWAKDTVSYSESDTLKFILNYGYDSLGCIINLSDTVTINPYNPPKKIMAVNSPVLSFSAGSGKTHPLSVLRITSLSPVKQFDSLKITLSKMDADSQYFPVKILLRPDTLNPCRILMSAVLEPESQYRLNVLPGFIFPVQHNTNDSMEWNFSVNAAETYGNLKVTVENAPEEAVFLLTDEKGNPRYTWKNDTVKTFSYLLPGKFRLMLFVDGNKNGKWDTGRYLAAKQPEKVIRYDKDVSIRANWDLEVIWTIKEEVNE